jgi:hypothetical protein
MNMHRRLPATEALQRDIEEHGMPRPFRRRKVAAWHPRTDESESKSSSFDMHDMKVATEPVEKSMEFPTIEWTLDEDETDHETRDMPPAGKSDDLFGSSSHHSEPILGKRIRLEHYSRLVRSKSLKSSLCYLAEGSVSRRSSILSAKEGSWGQFAVCDFEEEKRQVSEAKRSLNGTDQLDNRFDPFLMDNVRGVNDLE